MIELCLYCHFVREFINYYSKGITKYYFAAFFWLFCHNSWENLAYSWILVRLLRLLVIHQMLLFCPGLDLYSFYLQLVPLYHYVSSIYSLLLYLGHSSVHLYHWLVSMVVNNYHTLPIHLFGSCCSCCWYVSSFCINIHMVFLLTPPVILFVCFCWIFWSKAPPLVYEY